MSTKKKTAAKAPAKKATKTAKTATKKTKVVGFKVSATAAELEASIREHLKLSLARDTMTATRNDWWEAVCMAVRDVIVERFIDTMGAQTQSNARRVYYLSLEYLMGRLLSNNIHNCGIWDAASEAINNIAAQHSNCNFTLSDICEEEPDMGLGNGGLGRLAACFLDSLATLELPAVGYGIFYEFGLFRQAFENNRQVEYPDRWLSKPNPWPIMRPEYCVEVKMYGHTEMDMDENGDFRPKWVGCQTVIGQPYDIPICGYGAKTVNFLRLWESKASNDFDLSVFNDGSYSDAVAEKAAAEKISKVLYPNDNSENGKELRLAQQYFFVCCSLHDIIRRYFKNNEGWDSFPKKVAIQLNDTHPAIAVPELMRIFLDEECMDWDKAWGLCTRVFSYTNHTLLPEALERWSVPLFEKMLPRHLQIIYEINDRFLSREVEKCWPGNGEMKAKLSLIEEGYPKMIRMAYLSVVGSHHVNGVAALHTRLLKSRLFPEFNELYPDRIVNMTNGITPRRWLEGCNHGLSALINEVIGDNSWVSDLDKLRALEKYADDKAFQKRYMAIKHENKVRMAEIIKERCDGLVVSPDAIFDSQIKRLHEYKRQHLNLLHILYMYRKLLHDPSYDPCPRVFIFGAKAAPGYWLAKQIIHAINAVAQTINNDERIRDKIKVVFIPNYNISVTERIIPASDLSEQISTAGKEASGTGNMKLALNGALTIGTLDGANVEICEEVGEDNIFIFGNTVEQVEEIRARGYNPWDYYHSNDDIRAILDWLGSGYFTPYDHDALKPVRDSLLDGGDPYLVLADFVSYCEAHARVDAAYRDKSRWAKMAILNTARVGKFSSDRTISEYADQIWNLKPVKVD